MEATVIIKGIKGKVTIIGNLRTIISDLVASNEAKRKEFRVQHGYNGFVSMLVEAANYHAKKNSIVQVDEYTPETYAFDPPEEVYKVI